MSIVNTATSMGLVRLPAPSGASDLKPAPTVSDAASDARTQTFYGLLAKGHVSVAPLREPKLILHSHLPHTLGSAYGLGASGKQMTELYEHEVKTLIPIDETFVRGNKLTKETWRDFLQQKPYTVAFVDFFDDEVRNRNGNWKQVLEQYLYSGSEPLINGYIGGLGHPFIHLAYAYEYENSAIATEALSLGCTEYDPLHGVLDHYPPDNSTYKTTLLADVIQRVREDTRFDGLFTEPGILNIRTLLQKRFDAVMEHWNAFEVVNPVQQFEQCCDLSVLLAISSGNPEDSFDFFHAHVMTVAHALRVLWHYFPEKRRSSILRAYALFTIIIYIHQMKHSFDIEKVESVQLNGRDWNWVTESALKHKWALDTHFFKAVRAPKVFRETYGDKNDFYLKAAVKFISEFRGWEGFGIGVEGYIPSRDGYIPK